VPQKNQELGQCRVLIEEKLGWGCSENWSNQDFDQLSEQLAEETGVTLSSTTLKRVWGRVKYDSAPTTTTLNALAAYIGYQNWRHYQNVQQDLQPVEPESNNQLFIYPEPAPPVQTKLQLRTLHPWWTAAMLLVALIGIFIFIQMIQKPLPASDFAFSSLPVTKGIPNSVIFNYDASASPSDSVFIQQSWDPKRRQLVPKKGRQHTSIYYYPGYFRAKLLIGKQIVQEHNLIIPSEGWHVAIKQEPVPVYFNSTEVIHNGVLHLSVAAIQQQNIPMQPTPPEVQYRYVQNFKRLMNDNFVFETRLKNDYKQGSAACQNINLMILCRNQMFSIPLTAKGCVGNIGLFLAGHEAHSTTSDLSAFGADLSQWVTVRCEVKRKHLRLLVNGKKAYEATLTNTPVGIVGISYNFEGTGSVDYTRFSRPNGEVVFEEDFNQVLAVK
jgi:hypothetical protein